MLPLLWLYYTHRRDGRLIKFYANAWAKLSEAVGAHAYVRLFLFLKFFSSLEGWFMPAWRCWREWIFSFQIAASLTEKKYLSYLYSHTKSCWSIVMAPLEAYCLPQSNFQQIRTRATPDTFHTFEQNKWEKVSIIPPNPSSWKCSPLGFLKAPCVHSVE